MKICIREKCFHSIVIWAGKLKVLELKGLLLARKSPKMLITHDLILQGIDHKIVNIYIYLQMTFIVLPEVCVMLSMI